MNSSDVLDELQQAAAQALDDAANAAAALAPACDALQAAVDQVALAWAGGRGAQVGNLYQRQLQPLASLGASTADGPPRVPAALMESCRVFTPQDIHDAVWQAAGKPDMPALRSASATAAGHFVQALCNLHLLLESAVAMRGDNGELASLLLAASQLKLADKGSFADAWRQQQAQRGAVRQGPFDTLPAHIGEQAALQALRSPLDGLLQVARLLRQAADHLEQLPATSQRHGAPYAAYGTHGATVHVH